MGDHKCMNEYYPPDFDPTKLPRLRTVPGGNQKGGHTRDKILEIRTMLPWNIRCNTCGNYMHRGTKFNARVEAATDKPKYLNYVTIRRFYMTCTNCISTITFLTDPEVVDYAMESGATRLFETRRLCATLEKQEKDAEEEEAKKNPMAALEKRTKDSQREMLLLENLAELTEERRAKMKLTSDIMLHKLEKSAEAKEQIDNDILTKLAREVMHKETRLTEDDAERADAERKRKAEDKIEPVVDFGKKKKLLDNRKHLLGGFGGLKVKGKTLKVKEPEKPKDEPKLADNALGLLCAYSDSDSE